MRDRNAPRPRRPRRRGLPAAALAALLIGAVARAAGSAGPDDSIACYDATRQLVTHQLRWQCAGEVIDPAREAELAAARSARIRTVVQPKDGDPVTGKRRLVGTGSGFYIGAGGELLTNNHVIDRCEFFTATSDEGEKIAATLVAASPPRDIALLRTDRTPPGIARFSSAPIRSNGAQLAVVGYPAYGLPTRLSSLSPAHTDSALLATTNRLVEFAGQVRRGNSGSPLLDEAGDVVGVVNATLNTARYFQTTGRSAPDRGFAIPYSAVLQFLAENGVKPLFGEPPHAALGAEALHEKSRRFVIQIGCWK
jgi:S1-C subfamily serine protease